VLHYFTTISADTMLRQLQPTIFQIAFDSLAAPVAALNLPPAQAQMNRLAAGLAKIDWDHTS